MVKSELIKHIAENLNSLSYNDVELSVNQILSKMSEALCNNERIEIRGFGSFSFRYRPTRKARNPKTGETVITNPKYALHFKAGKELRERVNSARHIPIKDKERNK